MPRMEAIVRATSVCAGYAQIHGRAHGALVPVLRRWIADVSPPHVQGDCGCLVYDGRHHPLWPRPKNMMQTCPQTKLLRAKPQMLLPPTVLGHCVEQTLQTALEPTRLENRGMLGWQSPWEGASPAREKRGNDLNTNASGGATDTRIGCHGYQQGCQPRTYGGHPLWCIVQLMDDNPFATLHPKTKPVTQKPQPKGYPNGGSHPVGWTWQPSPMSTGFHPTSPIAIQIAVMVAIKQRVPVMAAMDNPPCHHHRWGLVWTTFLLVKCNGHRLSVSCDPKPWWVDNQGHWILYNFDTSINLGN